MDGRAKPDHDQKKNRVQRLVEVDLGPAGQDGSQEGYGAPFAKAFANPRSRNSKMSIMINARVREARR
jgi:hypothetical protein